MVRVLPRLGAGHRVSFTFNYSPLCSQSSTNRVSSGYATILAYFNVSVVSHPSAPLPVYILCIFVGDASLEITFATIALIYGMEFFLSSIQKERPTLIILQIF